MSCVFALANDKELLRSLQGGFAGRASFPSLRGLTPPSLCPRRPGRSPEGVMLSDASWASCSFSIWASIICKARPQKGSRRTKPGRPVQVSAPGIYLGLLSLPGLVLLRSDHSILGVTPRFLSRNTGPFTHVTYFFFSSGV